MSQSPLTREQLAEQFLWEDNFPPQVQERLYEHYAMFAHDGKTGLALLDIQSATDTLIWAVQGKAMSPFVAEHRQYFGEDSAQDLQKLIDFLLHLQQSQ